MGSPPDSAPVADDRRLWMRMRMAMVGAVLVAALIFAAGAVALGLLVSTYDRTTALAVELERAAALGERLGAEAVQLQRVTGEAQRFLAKAEFEAALAAFTESVRIASRGLPELSAAGTGGSPPERGAGRAALASRVAEALALGTRAAELPGGPEARRAARRLERLSSNAIARGLDALIARERRRADGLAARIQIAGLGAGLLALLMFAAQWYWVCRPLLGAIEARSRALLAANERVAHNMMYDALTGLPNRRTLHEMLSRFDPDAPLGLVHVDLAGFHSINATLGWETGEQLLCYAASTLGEIALTSDIVARVDSSAFVVATRRRTDADQLQEFAVEIIEHLARPLEIGGHSVSVEAVIGIAARRGPGDSPEKLLANADIARARAREEGGSVYFSSGMRERLAARRQTAQELLQALVRDEIEPYFQPQVESATGRLTGLEALVRWRHPERGVLNPHFFLDIAEQAHLGQRIAQVMVKKSIHALAEWRAQGFDIPRVGLNFSARQLRAPGLCDQLRFDLDRMGLGPGDLAIEVLESALIEGDDDPVLASIAALSRAGFHIDLDDFGTGHAALSYLRHHTVDRLKIDGSFVRDLHVRPELRKMTQAMIQLASTLGIRSLAEGVEAAEEWRLLVEMGCDDLQGFAIGRPMPAETVPDWLLEHDRRRSSGRVIAAA